MMTLPLDTIRTLGQVALNTFVIYIFLIVGFRIIGRRQLGQLTVVDLVIILIMGSAVETAMVSGNTSLPAGIVSSATLLLANRAVNKVCCRSRRLRHIVTGGPVLLISHGHVIEEHLKRAGLTHENLLEAIRGRGYCEVEDVKFAVLEEDGEVNAVPMTAKVVRTQEATVISRTLAQNQAALQTDPPVA